MTSTILDGLPPGAAIALIRLRSLGDCVLTTPAIAILKQARPDLRLAVVVEARFAAVYEGNPEVDEILQPETEPLRRWHPWLAINLHGGTRSAQLAMSSRAPLRAGFAHFRFQAIYNVRIPRAQEILGVERKVHTVEHIASAMFYLGAPPCEIPRARLEARATAFETPYAVFHPAASAPDKTWPAPRFREAAEFVKHRLGLEPVFIAGPADDLRPFAQYRCLQSAPLAQVKSLLAGAALFVGNDSGPAHMAAAFGLPVVVLFGSSDPEIWAPWKTEAVVLTSPQGIAAIPVERVIQAIASLHPVAALQPQPQ